LAEVIPTFNKQRFISQIFTDDFTQKKLKARRRHTSVVLRAFMASDFSQAIKFWRNGLFNLRKKGLAKTIWSLHKNEKVWRWSCEGSRPRLSRAMDIPALKPDL